MSTKIIGVATAAFLAGCGPSMVMGEDTVDPNCNLNELDFIMIDGDANLDAVEDDIRSDLGKIGLTVNRKAMSKDDFNAASKAGDFHLVFSETWGPPYDPHSFAQGWIAGDEGHKQAMTNLESPWTRDKIFKDIEEVLEETDKKRAEVLWKKIHSAVNQQAVMLPLWGKRIPTVLNRRLGGYSRGAQQYDYPVHRLNVLQGSKTVTIAPGAQTGLFQSVGPMNPHTYRPNEFFANNWVYEGLVSFNNQGKVEGALATSWTSVDNSEGGTTYTFELRENVTFHDGAYWDCEVCKKNFDNFMHPTLRTGDFHGWIGFISKIKEYSCTPAGDFVLTTNSIYYPTIQELSFIRPVRMLSPLAFVEGTTGQSCNPESNDPQKYPNLNCVGVANISGTGPFRFHDRTVNQTDPKMDNEVVFKANTEYWGGAPDIETLKIVRYDSRDKVVDALVHKKLDIVWGSGVVAASDIEMFEDKSPYTDYLETFYTEDLQNELLLVNSGKPPLDDINVRKAIMYAVNKAKIGSLERDANEATNIFPLATPFSRVKLVPTWDYDLERAEEFNCPAPVSKDAVTDNTPRDVAIGVSVSLLLFLAIASITAFLFWRRGNKYYERLLKEDPDFEGNGDVRIDLQDVDRDIEHTSENPQ